MRLAADLGGTHARFALGTTPIRYIRLRARDYAALDAAIDAALAAFDLDDARTIDAVLAVAGPVRGTTAAFTNLDWQADADALRERFGFASVRLLNDVECAAHGVAVELPADVIDVQPGARRDGAARHVLVSVGTGLGVAYWRSADDVEASEAGHAGFVPTTRWDHGFLDGGRATWEDALSGPGLVRIHRYVSGVLCADGAEVTQRAADGDPDAAVSIRQFSRLLGEFSGDLVLAAPAAGGVLLTGGVIAGLGAQFNQAAFIAGFSDKGTMAGLLAKVPVWRTADDGLALRGALL